MAGKTYIGTSGWKLQELASQMRMEKPFQRLCFGSDRARGEAVETWLKPGVNQICFWQCVQNHAVRPPIIADFNARPQRGHLPCFPRCVSSQDLGKRLKSVFNAIALSST